MTHYIDHDHIDEALADFIKEWVLPKQQHKTLELMSAMAYVFGLRVKVELIPNEKTEKDEN